jgi:uncharacterized protein DUF1850
VTVGRSRLLWAWVAALGVGGLAAGAAVQGPPAGPAVVVRDERGREVATARLPESGRFAVRYLHSVYRAPVTETFAAGPGHRFRLVAVASPSEAVLDYYALDGRRGSEGGWWRLEPEPSPRLEALPLLATEVGRRTLEVGQRRLRLYATGRPPVRLVLSVRG